MGKYKNGHDKAEQRLDLSGHPKTGSPDLMPGDEVVRSGTLVMRFVGGSLLDIGYGTDYSDNTDKKENKVHGASSGHGCPAFREWVLVSY